MSARRGRGAEVVAAAVDRAGGRLDVLVHNAGIFRATPLDGGDIDGGVEGVVRRRASCGRRTSSGRCCSPPGCCRC